MVDIYFVFFFFYEMAKHVSTYAMIANLFSGYTEFTKTYVVQGIGSVKFTYQTIWLIFIPLSIFPCIRGSPNLSSMWYYSGSG